jgi:hypothetical protein
VDEKSPTAGGMGLVLASWLVPGLGFLVKRDYWRGLTIFFLINATFAIGLVLHGTVLVPEFRISSPSFNIVALLTFVGEIGNAGATLFCLLHDWRGWHVFRGIEEHPYFDLASLYLLVSGCMNYFCVSNFYDRHVVGRFDSDASDEDN